MTGWGGLRRRMKASAAERFSSLSQYQNAEFPAEDKMRVRACPSVPNYSDTRKKERTHRIGHYNFLAFFFFQASGVEVEFVGAASSPVAYETGSFVGFAGAYMPIIIIGG
jgi:hypothetical protein